MKDIKIIKKFKRYSKLFNKYIPYVEIETPKTTVVRGITIHTINRYDVPRGQINNKQCYFPPLASDINYNTKQINKAYCKKLGLLNYKEICTILTKYSNLSIRQFANILGISPASLCNMKNGKILPSKLVSNILFLLSDKNDMSRLIKKHQKHTHLSEVI